VIKPRIRWAEQAARKERGEVYTGYWLVNLREIDHLENLGVEGGTLKCISKK
jgi:hypothetical protein